MFVMYLAANTDNYFLIIESIIKMGLDCQTVRTLYTGITIQHSLLCTKRCQFQTVLCISKPIFSVSSDEAPNLNN